ncbi:MAG: DUF6452 family protein [Flavobacteriaceae bacterium]
MKKLLFIITLLAVIISCEKDDICTETNADTAQLVIRFYDVADNDALKAVTNLLIIGENNALTYGIESTRDSIAIPLRILENNTSYTLIKDYAINDNGTPDDDSDDFTTGNGDDITISYQNNQIYISKACGFKNKFDDVNFGFTTDTDNWILNTTVENNTIENSNNAHVHIYH